MEGNASRKETAYSKFCKDEERLNTYSCDKKTMRAMHREKWNAMTKEEQKTYAGKNDGDDASEKEKKRKFTSTTSPFDKYFDETKTRLIEENQKFGFSSDDIRFIAIMKWKSMTDDERKVYFCNEKTCKRVRSKKQVPSMKDRVLALGDDINGVWLLLQTSFAAEIEEWRTNTEPAFSLKNACRKIEVNFDLPPNLLDKFRPQLKNLVSKLAERAASEEVVEVEEKLFDECVKFDVDEEELGKINEEKQTFDVENAIRDMY